MLCNFCSVIKTDFDFYSSNKTKCKACIRAAVIKNRNDKIEYYRSYDNMRASQPHRVAARKDYSLTNAGKASHKKALLHSKTKFPDKAVARYAVSNAVRDGRLEKFPCLVCGDPKSEGHHPDYSRHLDVVWLCNKHHRKAHAVTINYKEAA